MAMFLLNEAVFFFMLVVAFVYFRGSSLPVAAQNLSLTTATIYTACLLASSFTMWRATASAVSEHARSLRSWLGGTVVLGAVFLYGQAEEFSRLFHKNVNFSQGSFGTTFFTLTGLHGLHVLLGILLLGAALCLPAAGYSSGRQAVAVRTLALYWYFVDLVWIGIFSVVYLWTFL